MTENPETRRTCTTAMPRSIIYIWVSLILFAAVLYAVLHIYTVGNFGQLEREVTARNVKRLLRAVEDRRNYINSKASDWAAWDDAYQFVQDRNERFIRTNIVLSAFTGVDLNLIAYTDNSGQIVHAKWYDNRTRALGPVPPDVVEAVEGCRYLTIHRNVTSSVSGILLIDQGPMLVASRPVITSNEEGPIRGSLIFGRLLDAREVNSLSRLIGVAASIRRLKDGPLPKDVASARRRMWRSGQVIIRPINRNVIAGYSLIDDIYEKPVLIARIEMQRSIYNRALSVTNYSLAALIVLSLIFGVTNSWLILRGIRREREFDRKTHEFYRQTITAATNGKLIITSSPDIDRLCGRPAIEWAIREPDDLPDVRNTTYQEARSAGIDEDRAWKLATCVGEAATNALKHAGGGKARLCRRPDGLLFVMADHGPGIPALRIPDVALRRGYSTAGTLGMGYKVMIAFADKVYLATGQKGTTVAVEMKTEPDEPSGEAADLGRLT